jgi:hypothetical protein
MTGSGEQQLLIAVNRQQGTGNRRTRALRAAAVPCSLGGAQPCTIGASACWIRAICSPVVIDVSSRPK